MNIFRRAWRHSWRSFVRVSAVTGREFRQLSREKTQYPLLILAPVVQLVILGYAASTDIHHVPIVVCDLDRSVDSRAIVNHLAGNGRFAVVAEVARLDDEDAYIRRGDAWAAVHIPEGWGRDLRRGTLQPLGVTVDGTAGTQARVVIGYLNGLGRTLMADMPGVVAPELPSIRVLYNPASISRYYMLPAIVGLILMITTMLLSCLSLVRERELGTLEQLYATPVTRWQLIMGKLFPYMVIGTFDLHLVLGIAMWWFGLPFRGSLLDLYLVCGTFLLTTLGLGMLVSVVTRTQFQALLVFLMWMTPNMLLSGFMFPIENMPRFLQLLSYTVPLRYFLEIVRSLFLKGAPLTLYAHTYEVLLGYGLVAIAAGTLSMRKQVG